MELRIRPALQNSFPLAGFYIRGASLHHWLFEIQSLGLALPDVEFFPLPGARANSTWGCLVLVSDKHESYQNSRHECCQCVCPGFYIPEKSEVSPLLCPEDRELLFRGKMHIFHPETGFVIPEEKISPERFLVLPAEKTRFSFSPEAGLFIPERVKSFQVKVSEAEDPLKSLEEKVVAKREKIPSDPLNLAEKVKLGFYKLLFSRKATTTGGGSGNSEVRSWLDRIPGLGRSKNRRLLEKMQQDFENLEERNQKQLEKLMKLLRENPEEALKYAIPIDNSGAARGNEGGFLDLGQRWRNFSLFQHSSNSGQGRVVDLGDYGNQLTQQYLKTAEDLVKRGEYEKAAFVYMKLLKNNYKAAMTLEEGHFYKEAAAIYLQHLKNTPKAAECFEKGNITDEAIKLYLELKNHEKVGDLYLKINERSLAYRFYEQSVTESKSQNKYVHASLIYRNKMNDSPKARETLLEGWNGGHEPGPCLEHYFNAFDDRTEKKIAIDYIYGHKTAKHQRKIFLDVIEKEHRKQDELAPHLREIAYEIIAAEAHQNPSVLESLKRFNPLDKEISKDTSRFRSKRK